MNKDLKGDIRLVRIERRVILKINYEDKIIGFVRMWEIIKRDNIGIFLVFG